jgi:hypothetical protein
METQWMCNKHMRRLAILQFKDSERKRKAQEKDAINEERESKRLKNVVGAITKALTLIEKGR